MSLPWELFAYLCERAGIKLVLGSNLKSNITASGRVPRSFRTDFDLSVDLVIVACREDAQVVGGSDSCGI